MGDCSRGCFALLQQANPRLTIASANRDLVEVTVQGPPGAVTACSRKKVSSRANKA